MLQDGSVQFCQIGIDAYLHMYASNYCILTLVYIHTVISGTMRYV